MARISEAYCLLLSASFWRSRDSSHLSSCKRGSAWRGGEAGSGGRDVKPSRLLQAVTSRHHQGPAPSTCGWQYASLRRMCSHTTTIPTNIIPSTIPSAPLSAPPPAQPPLA
jgi:hypothetical protein